MIINANIGSRERAAYYCNGSNDDVALKAFIESVRARYLSNYTVEVIGTFGKSGTAAIYIDNSNYTRFTLDFSKCNTIVQPGAFLSVVNVAVKNLDIYQPGDTADSGIHTLAGNDAIFENCSVRGIYTGGDCRAFSVSNSRIINCECEAENTGGSLYGIYAFGSLITGCRISVKASASAYGIEAATGSFVSDCKFKGETTSTSATASGNGGIGGGYYSNCQFIGIGSIKGQGFYVRGGTWLTVTNCIFRGYTKNTTSGWGIGILGQANDGTTISLLGINCNQETLTGYSQSKSMEFTLGYGVYAGTFFTAPAVPDTITALGSYNRNRT